MVKSLTVTHTYVLTLVAFAGPVESGPILPAPQADPTGRVGRTHVRYVTYFR